MNLGDSGTQLSTGKDIFSGPGSDEVLNSTGELYANREVMSRERIRTHMVLLPRKTQMQKTNAV